MARRRRRRRRRSSLHRVGYLPKIGPTLVNYEVLSTRLVEEKQASLIPAAVYFAREIIIRSTRK